MRTAIYARLSRRTDKNVANLATQVKRCHETAQARGWDVVEVIEDLAESAYDRAAPEDRPGFGRLINMVRSRELDVVLAWRPDRLFRDPIEAATFLRDCSRHGVATVSTVEEGDRDPSNPGDEMVSTIVAAVGRYESAAKSARLQSKARQLAEAGRPAGGPAPFGYDRHRRIDPVEAAYVRELVDRALAGESMRSLARWLNEQGSTTKLGKAWQPSNVARLLTRPHIAALRQHRGKIIGEATWEPIIPIDRWMELRALLSDPRRRVNAHGRPYLLTGGIARCGVCEGPLIARPASGSIRRYCCPSTTDIPAGCGRIQRAADPVEAEVLARLWALIAAGERPPTPEAPPPPDAAGALERLAELSRDYYIDRLITKTEFLAARAPLQRAVDAANAVHPSPVPALPPPEEWERDWHRYEQSARRAMIATFIEQVVILTAVRGRNTFDPGCITVRWRC